MNIFNTQFYDYQSFLSVHGKNLKSIVYAPFSDDGSQATGIQTVTFEARQLKAVLLKLYHS